MSARMQLHIAVAELAYFRVGERVEEGGELTNPS